MKSLLPILFLASQFAHAQSRGTIKIDTLVSTALANNITHENNKRAVTIYLPPGYADSEKRYPVLYLLHGIGDDNMDFSDDSTEKYRNIQDLMDTGIASGKFYAIIIVTPNEKTNCYGSFYTNSVATGNWEDFTVTELVNYIDSKYRTLAKASSRAVAGHSMGGFGAVTLAMKHPDVFSIAYGMNSAFIGFVGEFRTGERQMREFVRARTSTDYAKLFVGKQFIAVGSLAVSQAFSPNPGNPPFYSNKPFKMLGNKVVPNPAAWQQWSEHDVVRMAEKYKENLSQLRGLKFDSGIDDEYQFIPINSRLFSKKLTALHIPHQFEEYNGDHRNRLWGLDGRIYNEVLPFISGHIINNP